MEGAGGKARNLSPSSPLCSPFETSDHSGLRQRIHPAAFRPTRPLPNPGRRLQGACYWLMVFEGFGLGFRAVLLNFTYFPFFVGEVSARILTESTFVVAAFHKPTLHWSVEIRLGRLLITLSQEFRSRWLSGRGSRVDVETSYGR